MTLLRILGWIVVVLLGLSILYSGHFHSRNYARIRARAEMEGPGAMKEMGLRMARQYMWRTIFWQFPKLVVIAILVNLFI